MAKSDPVLDFMRLIWAIDHELQRVSKRMEITHGLTVPQRMTLLLIGRMPGVTAGELASLLHLHPGTVSGIIRRLQASGFLERAGDDADARRRRLTLTDRGVKANDRRSGTFENAVRRVLAATSANDLDTTDRVLTKLADELRATTTGAGDQPRRRRDLKR